MPTTYRPGVHWSATAYRPLCACQHKSAESITAVPLDTHTSLPSLNTKTTTICGGTYVASLQFACSIFRERLFPACSGSGILKPGMPDICCAAAAAAAYAICICNMHTQYALYTLCSVQSALHQVLCCSCKLAQYALYTSYFVESALHGVD